MVPLVLATSLIKCKVLDRCPRHHYSHYIWSWLGFFHGWETKNKMVKQGTVCNCPHNLAVVRQSDDPIWTTRLPKKWSFSTAALCFATWCQSSSLTTSMCRPLLYVGCCYPYIWWVSSNEQVKTSPVDSFTPRPNIQEATQLVLAFDVSNHKCQWKLEVQNSLKSLNGNWNMYLPIPWDKTKLCKTVSMVL